MSENPETKANKYYVVMTDKFLSGWGFAEGRTSKFIIECDTLADAEMAYKRAKSRDEMKNVFIASTVPYYRAKRYHVKIEKFADCYYFNHEPE